MYLFFKFQSLISSTSRQLFESTSGRGRFSTVTVVLPASWAGTACTSDTNVTVDSVYFAGNVDADFNVEGPHPIFGSEPWARQFGQCGNVGQGVQVPFPALTQITENLGEKLEKIHNKYGIFIEILENRFRNWCLLCHFITKIPY